MFARLTIVEVPTDKVDYVIKIFEDSIVPAAKSQKGAHGIHMLADRSTGKGIALSFWDSEEDAITNEQSGYYQEQVSKVAQYFTKSPIREGY